MGIETQTALTWKRGEVLTVSNRLLNQIFQSGRCFQAILDTEYSDLFILFLFLLNKTYISYAHIGRCVVIHLSVLLGNHTFLDYNKVFTWLASKNCNSLNIYQKSFPHQNPVILHSRKPFRAETYSPKFPCWGCCSPLHHRSRTTN